MSSPGAHAAATEDTHMTDRRSVQVVVLADTFPDTYGGTLAALHYHQRPNKGRFKTHWDELQVKINPESRRILHLSDT